MSLLGNGRFLWGMPIHHGRIYEHFPTQANTAKNQNTNKDLSKHSSKKQKPKFEMITKSKGFLVDLESEDFG